MTDNKDNKENNHQKAPKGKVPQFNWKNLALWLVIFVVVILLFQYLNDGTRGFVQISFSEFMEQVESENVDEITFLERDIEGKLKKESSFNVGTETVNYSDFKLRLPFEDPDLVKNLRGKGIEITAEEKGMEWFDLLLKASPLILIIFLWFFLMRQMRGSQSGIFNFGRSKAKTVVGKEVDVTFDDVAGAEGPKNELQEIIEYLRKPTKFSRLGGKVPKGVLLVGPPGTGKTLLSRAVAGEADVPFFSISGSDFVEMFVGVGASRVRDLFKRAKQNRPAIIFIDEIDAVGRQRGAGLGGGHDEREQTLNQLLGEMDGFEKNEELIIIAATNRPDVLDPALLRPGRFDRKVIINLPDLKERLGILKVHTTEIPLAEDVDLKQIARGCPGLSGADLANIANEAAIMAAKEGANEVAMQDFEDAKDKIIMGAERKSLMISEKERKITAYHEAGHALLGSLLPNTDILHKVSIIPRGQGLGGTHFLPQDDVHLHSKSSLERKLAHLLGGRAAEELVFNDITTGAEQDIQQATKIAHKMVVAWGMSQKVGPIDLNHIEEEPFLGREITRQRNFSEKTAEIIDEEVAKLVEEAQSNANAILKEHRGELDLLANALLERETLSRNDIDELLKGSGTKKPADDDGDEESIEDKESSQSESQAPTQPSSTD